MIFLKYHSPEKCKVSYLAQEFSLSKPTISEAVRTLLKKGLIGKETAPEDTRSFSIHLSAEGEKLASETASFANGLLPAFGAWSGERKKNFYGDLLQLIASLQKLGFISIQRSCLKCRFFRQDKKGYYCKLLKMPLQTQGLRVDCPEFEEA